VTFPRTSREYFKINELRAARAFESAEKAGEPIKVIYHSHCDAGAYFSAEDAATFASDNVLMWPCAFIVVSVQGGKVAETKLWVHKPGTNDFRESTLHIS
jgi:proteasome lid subunit RPN8/RPN11